MKTFLVTAILLLAAVAGMAITIIVKPGGKFPDGEISHNKSLRKQGIVCAKEEELRTWGRRGMKKHPAASHPTECPPGGFDACAFGKTEEGKVL